ncbi:hypothetical protein Hanom_Chr04g00360141 [Helianthus anomalus]
MPMMQHFLPSNQGLKAENATTELCPPKPNEFEIPAHSQQTHLILRLLTRVASHMY